MPNPNHSASSLFVSITPTSLPFFLYCSFSGFRLFLSVLSSSPSFFLCHILWHIAYGRNSLSSSFVPFSDCNEHPATHFFQVKTRQMSWPCKVWCFSRLLPRIVLSPCLSYPLNYFLHWRRTASTRQFDTQVTQHPLKNSSFLVMLAVSSLVFAATGIAIVWTFIFFVLLFYLPYLSSIHEKANCIAILWTGSPHSLELPFSRFMGHLSST